MAADKSQSKIRLDRIVSGTSRLQYSGERRGHEIREGKFPEISEEGSRGGPRLLAGEGKPKIEPLPLYGTSRISGEKRNVSVENRGLIKT